MTKNNKSLISILTFFSFLSAFLTSALVPKISYANQGPLYKNYQETLRKIQNQDIQSDYKELDPYKVIFVPGIWSKLYPKLISYARFLGLNFSEDTLVSFADQMKFFDELGIEYEVAPINTSNGCQSNSKVLANLITNSPKKVLLISHSKGGVDILHALSSNPEIAEKIHGWISFQAPFYGTPMVNMFGSLPITRFITELQSLTCLEPEFRMNFLRETNGKLKNILTKIRMITVASSLDKKEVNEFKDLIEEKFFYFNESLFRSTLNLLKAYPFYLDSDGLVPVSSACFASTSHKCLVLDSLDHAGPVMDLPYFQSLGREKRLLMTRTLINLINNQK